jgi:hypothetical protein
MTKYLLTPSLLNAYQYYIKSTKDDAKDDFIRTLKREPFTNEAMERGIRFENNVKSICDGKDIEVEINKTKYLLYGRADIVKRDTIYDIKTTKEYKLGKYMDSCQHLFYMYCMNINNFAYLVAEGSSKLKSWYKEDYNFSKEQEKRLFLKLNNFLNFLKDYKEFNDLFINNWKCK